MLLSAGVLFLCDWYLSVNAGNLVGREFRLSEFVCDPGILSNAALQDCYFNADFVFSSDRTAGGPSRYSFVKTTDETSRWVFNFQTTILRERGSLLNKSLTVLGSKDQQGLASHVQESNSEAQLNTGQLKCLKLQQLAVKTVNLSLHLAIDWHFQQVITLFYELTHW